MDNLLLINPLSRCKRSSLVTSFSRDKPLDLKYRVVSSAHMKVVEFFIALGKSLS